jgi:hypothetical protein
VEGVRLVIAWCTSKPKLAVRNDPPARIQGGGNMHMQQAVTIESVRCQVWFLLEPGGKQVDNPVVDLPTVHHRLLCCVHVPCRSLYVFAVHMCVYVFGCGGVHSASAVWCDGPCSSPPQCCQAAVICVPACCTESCVARVEQLCMYAASCQLPHPTDGALCSRVCTCGLTCVLVCSAPLGLTVCCRQHQYIAALTAQGVWTPST